MDDLLKFLNDVFWHWQSWVGGSGLGGAVIVIISIYERLSGHNMSKRMYVTIFIAVFLFGAFYMAWRDQYHARLSADQGKANAEQRFEELTKPNFEVLFTSVYIGELNLSDIQTHTSSKSCVVLASVAVFNKGAPSVLRGWGMTIKLLDGREVSGTPWLPGGENAPRYLRLGVSKSGPIDVATAGSLFLKGTAAPIAQGGSADGHMIFRFPVEIMPELDKAGVVINIKLLDILNHTYDASYTITGNKSDDLLASPSMR
jgi:hypothetical protein